MFLYIIIEDCDGGGRRGEEEGKRGKEEQVTKIGGGFAAEPKFFGREWRKILAGLMEKWGVGWGFVCMRTERSPN